MIKENLNRIKETNAKDFKALVIAAGLHKEYQNEGNTFMERQMIAVITGILDKYDIKYVNDLC